jgi:hypothetical protein
LLLFLGLAALTVGFRFGYGIISRIIGSGLLVLGLVLFTAKPKTKNGKDKDEDK